MGRRREEILGRPGEGLRLQVEQGRAVDGGWRCRDWRDRAGLGERVGRGSESPGLCIWYPKTCVFRRGTIQRNLDTEPLATLLSTQAWGPTCGNPSQVPVTHELVAS